MKIIYMANVRIPTEKAHGSAIMRMCEAFAREGVEVELVVPRRINAMKDDPFEYYGIEKNFKIRKLPTLDLTVLGKAGHLVQSSVFALAAFGFSLFKKTNIFYGRDELSLSLVSIFRKDVVWEAHTPKKKWLVAGLLKRCKKLVVISNGLKDYYVAFGVPEEKILVAPSGVDVAQFKNIKESKSELREKLSLSINEKIALYAGHLYEWKGIETLKKAETLLPDGVKIIIVSGKVHREVPMYLKAADVLVLPNSAKDELSRTYTSPLKLFEYMASGVPIVASDIPSIRDILSESEAYFFRPDDPESLVHAVTRAIEGNPTSPGNIEKARQFSWENRAKKLLSSFDLSQFV